MAKDSDQLTGGFETDNTGGLLTGFLADEDAFDRRSLWRLGSWGAGAVGAVVLAVLAGRSQISMQREQFAAADLARQAQQIQSLAKESQNETRRLASAVDTLNGDRDRLFSRITVLEQGLDAVTGSIDRQNSTKASQQAVPLPSIATQVQAAAQSPVPPPVVAPVMTTVAAVADKSQSVVEATPAPAAPTSAAAPGTATMAGGTTAPGTTASTTPAPATSPPPAATASTPLVAAKSIMGPPDPAAAKLIEPEKPEKSQKSQKPETAEKTEKSDRPDKPAKTVTAAPMPDVVVPSTPPAPEMAATETDEAQAAAPRIAVQRTEFGVDVGGANSIPGLRALWRGLLKSRSNAALTSLHPIIVIRENSSGLGMQLRLVAGPLSDAAAAAKICASIENDRNCETTVFDGQRLAMSPNEPAGINARPVPGRRNIAKSDTAKSDTAKSDTAKADAADPEPVKPVARPVVHRRSYARHVPKEEPTKKPDPPSALSSFFSRAK